jgi:hypothetical protein
MHPQHPPSRSKSQETRPNDALGSYALLPPGYGHAGLAADHGELRTSSCLAPRDQRGSDRARIGTPCQW